MTRKKTKTMLTIKAEAHEIRRVKVLPPDDGVHRASNKTGYLKGVHSFMFKMPDGSQVLVPKGQTGFWWQNKKTTGIKVFFKLDTEGCYAQKLKAVKKEWRNRKKLQPYGVVPKSHNIVRLHLKLKLYDRDGKLCAKINCDCYGIKTDVVFWPREIWHRYAQGYPYDFEALDLKEHPHHTPEHYKAFADKVYRACRKTGVKVCGGDRRPKLGDISYCTRRKRWYQVDVA